MDVLAAWHFRCAPLDARVSEDQIRKLYAWHLERLAKRLDVSIQRTEALKEEVCHLMRKAGNTEVEIQDFLEGFSIYDEEQLQ